MPQLDQFIFFSVFFWVILFFSISYYIFIKYVIVNIYSNLKIRKLRINSFLLENEFILNKEKFYICKIDYFLKNFIKFFLYFFDYYFFLLFLKEKKILNYLKLICNINLKIPLLLMYENLYFNLFEKNSSNLINFEFLIENFYLTKGIFNNFYLLNTLYKIFNNFRGIDLYLNNKNQFNFKDFKIFKIPKKLNILKSIKVQKKFSYNLNNFQWKFLINFLNKIKKKFKDRNKLKKFYLYILNNFWYYIYYFFSLFVNYLINISNFSYIGTTLNVWNIKKNIKNLIDIIFFYIIRTSSGKPLKIFNYKKEIKIKGKFEIKKRIFLFLYNKFLYRLFLNYVNIIENTMNIINFFKNNLLYDVMSDFITVIFEDLYIYMKKKEIIYNI